VFIQNVASASNVPRNLHHNRDSVAVNLSEYQGRSSEMEVLREGKSLKGEEKCGE
jgi:hypothetical protein